jgi:hypothetical protein
VTRKTKKIYWENVAAEMAAQTVDSAMDLHKRCNYEHPPAVELVLSAAGIVDPDNPWILAEAKRRGQVKCSAALDLIAEAKGGCK